LENVLDELEKIEMREFEITGIYIQRSKLLTPLQEKIDGT